MPVLRTIDNDSFVEEPDVQEFPGLEDIVIDGFVMRTKQGSVRLIGYMRRGEGDREIIEPSVVIHLSPEGWSQSFASACRRIQEAARGVH
jgi:hypothetical protein